MATFVTFLWDGRDFGGRSAGHDVPKYTMRHVAALVRMLRRHGGHKLVLCGRSCDDPSIGFVRMPDAVIAMPGFWPKLWGWSKELGEQVGERFCLIDLDVVVLGDLGPLFSMEFGKQSLPDLVFWDRAKGELYNTSLVIMEPGCRSDIWETFSLAAADDLSRCIARGGHPNLSRMTGDQTWVAHILGPGHATVGEREGIYLYRPRLHRLGPPAGCRALFTCGPFDPAKEAETVSWIRENWG